MSGLEEKIFREYMTFFEKAERERRWNVFQDIPWDRVNKEASEELALCAETFCSVEMYLPDYVSNGINIVRSYFGQAWFQAFLGALLGDEMAAVQGPTAEMRGPFPPDRLHVVLPAA